MCNQATENKLFVLCVHVFEQVLQHCLCLGLNHVLYVVAKCSEIIYSVMVNFSPTIMSMFERAVTSVFTTYVPWLQDFNELPHYEEEDAWGYATSRAIAIQNLQLRENYVQEVQSRGCPLPELKKVGPAVITGWNWGKSGIDSPCHFLK